MKHPAHYGHLNPGQATHFGKSGTNICIYLLTSFETNNKDISHSGWTVRTWPGTIQVCRSRVDALQLYGILLLTGIILTVLLLFVW